MPAVGARILKGRKGFDRSLLKQFAQALSVAPLGEDVFGNDGVAAKAFQRRAVALGDGHGAGLPHDLIGQKDHLGLVELNCYVDVVVPGHDLRKRQIPFFWSSFAP